MNIAPITAADIPFDEKHAFVRVGDGCYRLTVESLGIEIEADRLWRDRHELSAELTVYCSLKGARTYDGCLSRGNFNLSSPTARERHAKYLRDRARTAPEAIDWHGLLEEFCIRVGNAEREGQPARLLRDYDRPSPDDTHDIAGLSILKRHPQLMFGDGGSFKSYLGLYLAAELATRNVQVLYADWELAGEDHRDRLERLLGAEATTGLDCLHYVRCERPMVAEADRIRRIIADLGIEFVVCDSVAFAANGAPEAAEVAAAYFLAVRQFGALGSLHIAHVTKPKEDEGAKSVINMKPFGSVFWHNAARSTWYVKRSADTGDGSRIAIGIYHQKANLGPLRAAVGFEIAFGTVRTEIRRVDIADIVDLAAGLPLKRRIFSLLKSGPQTIATLADELGKPADSVKKTLTRDNGHTFVCITKTDDGIHRWALAERRMAS